MTKTHSFLVLAISMFFLSSYTSKPQTVHAYQLSEVQTIEGIEDLSGITFSESSQTFWVVNNSPELLIEIDQFGRKLRSLPFSEEIKDTEDIAWIKDDLFAVVEEVENRVLIIKVLPTDLEISMKNVVQSWTAPGDFKKNKGLESIAYDRVSNKLWCSSEKYPIRFFEVNFIDGELIGNEIMKDSLICHEVGDISSMTFHENNPVLLSDDSNMALFLNDQQKEKGRLLFSSGLNGLSDSIEQPEGILFKNDKLYVVSEPNQIYIFEKAQ
ncbi:MAG: SdiA-regulated domain-containing protein [Lentisphaeraceae bacterium]|nr:SdiA-regulated domain-containing protein [Lentisphaeraceae bacterium]